MSDPRPVFGPATELVYASLPEVYRDADAAQDTGPSNYPLLRYLSGVLDQLTPLATYLDRFAYEALDERDNTDPAWDRFGQGTYGEGTYGDADSADLVDPYLADAGWLPWLAQLVGVDVTNLTVAQQRAAIASAAASPPTAPPHRGTPRAIAAKARPKLTGGQYVDVRPHHQGDPYVIAVATKRSETTGATTWGELEVLAPTWADLEALGDWSNLEAADVMVEALKERPAGYKLEHVYLEDLTA